MRQLPIALLLLSLSIGTSGAGDECATITTPLLVGGDPLTFGPVTEEVAGFNSLKGYRVTDGDGDLIQFIPHSFLAGVAGRPLSLVDFDFDGYLDLMLLDGASSYPNMDYHFWRFDVEMGRFVEDDRLEGISSGDADRELLGLYGRSGPTKTSATFKWLGDKLVPVERLSVYHDDDDGGLLATLSLYEGGKLRKRVTGDDWTSKVEYPYTVTVERFDEGGKLLSKRQELRLEPGH